MSNHTKKQPKMYVEKYGQTPCTEYKALLGAYIIPPEQSAPAPPLQPLRQRPHGQVLGQGQHLVRELTKYVRLC